MGEVIPQYCYFEIWITASHKKNFSTNEREKMENSSNSLIPNSDIYWFLFFKGIYEIQSFYKRIICNIKFKNYYIFNKKYKFAWKLLIYVVKMTKILSKIIFLTKYTCQIFNMDQKIIVTHIYMFTTRGFMIMTCRYRPTWAYISQKLCENRPIVSVHQCKNGKENIIQKLYILYKCGSSHHENFLLTKSF